MGGSVCVGGFRWVLDWEVELGGWVVLGWFGLGLVGWWMCGLVCGFWWVVG